jgi:glycosyltransferase involved in cell wall biosynthesis
MPGPIDANIIYLTAGAGGMYCGSCLHDNALAAALTKAGWNVQLVPTYTPIRTDESDVSVDHVLFGGLNVYLQQKIPLFRHLPAWVDSFLDNPSLIKRVTANAMNTDAKTLGSLAHSMLLGEKGNQRKEVRRVSDWLESQNPDLLVFSNVLIAGCIEPIKRRLNAPVLVTLQGDDVFLDSLQEPWRSQCMARIRQITKSIDGFIVHSDFFRDYMADYFSIPKEKFHVTPLGIDTADFESLDLAKTKSAGTYDNKNHSSEVTIGYLARLAPEKGLANLVDALLRLDLERLPPIRLKVAGWLGPDQHAYADEQWAKLEAAGWQDRYEYLGAIERDQKLDFLQSIDLFCVPTVYQEPKGLYAIEAMAAGVPIVASNHGAFPELIAASGGGILAAANDADSLAQQLTELIVAPDQRISLGRAGRSHALSDRTSNSMALATGEVFRLHLDTNCQ